MAPGILKIRQINISRNELVQAIILSAVMTAVYYYWFAVADRNYLFLYKHYGWGPFHPMTTGRYWMTGLVLSSFITLLYTIINLFNCQNAMVDDINYSRSSWKHVWLLCMPVVIVVIPLIVMNVNSPVMPLSIAIACVIAASAGLAIGLHTAGIFLSDVKKFFVISIDGFALVPPLILMLSLELPAKGVLNMSYQTAIGIALVSIAVSFLGLFLISCIFKWRRITPGKGYEIFISGLFFSYLVLPMVHFLFATPPGRPYITTSDNFFPDSFHLKILTWLTAAVITAAAVKFRKKILINI
jgi:hypothetical protein